MILDFTKVIVIQSLDEAKEKLTGTILYNEVLQYFSVKYSDKRAEIVNVVNKDDLFSILDKIENDCLERNDKPIIHFEVHGIDGGKGIKLKDDYVDWAELYNYFIRINTASSWGLFLTMAVCYGNSAMRLINPINPSPFYGIVGSFDVINEDDLMIRYRSFYNELLSSLDFTMALEALYKSNLNLPNSYGFIGPEQLFQSVYQDYLDEEFSNLALKSRFDNAIKKEGKVFNNRKEKRQYEKDFRKHLLLTKKSYYNEHKSKFFMFEKYPQHKNRFCVNWEPKY